MGRVEGTKGKWKGNIKYDSGRREGSASPNGPLLKHDEIISREYPSPPFPHFFPIFTGVSINNGLNNGQFIVCIIPR